MHYKFTVSFVTSILFQVIVLFSSKIPTCFSLYLFFLAKTFYLSTCFKSTLTSWNISIIAALKCVLAFLLKP